MFHICTIAHTAFLLCGAERRKKKGEERIGITTKNEGRVDYVVFVLWR